MGLDMYLHVRKYVSKYKYNDGERTDVPEFSTLADMSGIDNLSKYSGFAGIEVSYPVAQWRKANGVHNWFVNNLANGDDNCEPVFCSRSDLNLLLDACKKVLAETEPDEKTAIAEDVGLEPTPGFFFGSTEIDEWYDADLKYTVEMLEHLLSVIPEDSYDWSFVYQASW